MDHRKLTKTELPGFVKDEGDRAILNTNNTALKAYKLRKKQADRMKSQEDRINKIESDIAEIKKLLKALVNDNR